MSRSAAFTRRHRRGRPGLVSVALGLFLQLLLLTGPMWETSRVEPVDLRVVAHLAAGGSVLNASGATQVRHDETSCLACVTSSLVARLQAGTPVFFVAEVVSRSTEPTIRVSLPFAPPSSLHSRAPPRTA